MPARTRSWAQSADDGVAVGAVGAGRRPDLLGQLCGEIVDVGAVVAVLGQVLAQLAGDDRGAEVADLARRSR